jgi:esterase/lipase
MRLLRAGLALALVIGIAAWIAMRPVELIGLGARAHPAATYEDALQLYEGLRALDGADVQPDCRTELLDQGHKAGRAVVLIHGVTNCPRQFHDLGTMLHARGYNVLIPRIPHHGLVDRMTKDQARLSAQELVAITAVSVDIARGLGDSVVVVGLSMSGVMAAWAAQHRSDVDLAVVLAPSFSYRMIGRAWVAPAASLMLRLPNFYVWWNPKAKENRPGSDSAYPRVASRALGEILRLSLAVQKAAERQAPAARSILVITNANDTAIDRGTLESVEAHWRSHGVRNLTTYEFNRSLHLPHDLVDPLEVGQRVDLVYPALIALIEGAR